MSNSVEKRLVYFLGGFDPRGGRHYYSLFKKEATLMAKTSEAKINVTARKRINKTIMSWQVEYSESSTAPLTHTEFRVLDYSEIVRKNWVKSDFLALLKSLKTLCFLAKNNWLKNNTLVIILQIFGPPLFVCGLMLTILSLAISISTLIFLLTTLHVILKIFLTLAVVLSHWKLAKWLDKKLNFYWLIRGICFSSLQEQYDEPLYEPLMQDFTDEILHNAKKNHYDEIIIVGHSSGAFFATELAARCYAKNKGFADGRSEINIMTLGHCITLMSGCSIDKGYHQYLSTLAKSTNIDWLDFSDPKDIAASYKTDPIKMLPTEIQSEIQQHNPNRQIPRLQRAQFFKLFNKKQYNAFKKDKYRVHFQFLQASPIDPKGGYNYFRLTCGNKTLRQSYPSTEAQ